MKLVKTRLAKLLVIMVTMLPLAGVSAAEEFMKSALITRIDAGTVKLYLYDDIKFRFKTSTTIKNPNVKNPGLSDFKRGDNVYLQGEILNGVYYVDLIQYLPRQPG